VAREDELCGELEDTGVVCETTDAGAPDLMPGIDFAEPGLLERALKAIIEIATTLIDNTRTARPAPRLPSVPCLASSGQ
jgi:hypothetical protein